MTTDAPQLRLPYGGELDWDALLGYFAIRAIAGVESVEGQVYRRTVELDGLPGALELRWGGRGHLRLTVHLSDTSDLAPIIERTRRIFALDRDPAASNEVLGRDALFTDGVRRRPGLRVPGTWDPYETGVRAIVGQQVSMRGASTVTARIVERAGRRVRGYEHLGLTHTFPDPVALSQADLAGIGMPDSRARAVKAFAAAVDKGDLALDGGASLEELMASLTSVPGLGPWTASCIALRMGETDAFPVADLGLRRAANPGGEPLSAARLAKRAEPWRPHRAAAAVRLWMG